MHTYNTCSNVVRTQTHTHKIFVEDKDGRRFYQGTKLLAQHTNYIQYNRVHVHAASLHNYTAVEHGYKPFSRSVMPLEYLSTASPYWPRRNKSFPSSLSFFTDGGSSGGGSGGGAS